MRLFIVAVVACVLLAGAEHAAPHGPRSGAGPGGQKKATRQLRSAVPVSMDPHEALRQAVSSALGVGHDINHAHLEATRQILFPMWRSLAKNEFDRVDRRSLRYSVHRYFLQKYSLSVVGLEPMAANTSHAEAVLLTQAAPAYVRTVLEGNANKKGFSIEDAVAMIATLERLIADAGHDLLETVYWTQNLDSESMVTHEQLAKLMQGYMLRWMMGDDQEGIEVLEANRTLVEESFDDWHALAGYAEGRISAFEYQRTRRPRANEGKKTWAAMQPSFSFSDAQEIVSGITMTFGKYWETECYRVKESLMQMDYGSVGRVKLSDFHSAALDGEWRFSESKEYLRMLGALDESSNIHGARVIIPNYMQAASNCIISAPHYRVCCANECEDYLAEIEAFAKHPLATPEEILAVVKNLTRSLESGPPKVDGTLTRQLHEIARASHGRIPLHGRLFTQWLHYVFPQECPFPHKAGTTTTMTPLEFGQEYMASTEEMGTHASSALPRNISMMMDIHTEDFMTAWSEEEEHVSDHLHLHLKPPWESSGPSAPLIGMVMSAAVGFFIYHCKSSKTASGNPDLLPVHGSAGWSMGGKAHSI